MSLQQTLEQKRAAAAWADVSEAKDTDYAGRYRSWVKKFPALVLTNGLGQALAFTLAKRKPHHDAFYHHLSDWVMLQMGGTGDLMEWVRTKDSAAYRRATTETLAFVNWLKRFSEAEIDQEADSE